MRNDQLSRYIDRQKERGASNTRLFQTELHNRYAAIFSAFILTFIGAVLSAKKMKNGLGINLVHFADRERRADGTLDSGVDTERGLHHRSPLAVA